MAADTRVAKVGEKASMDRGAACVLAVFRHALPPKAACDACSSVFSVSLWLASRRVRDRRTLRFFRQRDREDPVAAAAAAFAAAGADGDELLTVHHVDRRRREHAGAGVELPQQLAAVGVVGEQVTGGVAA